MENRSPVEETGYSRHEQRSGRESIRKGKRKRRRSPVSSSYSSSSSRSRSPSRKHSKRRSSSPNRRKRRSFSSSSSSRSSSWSSSSSSPEHKRRKRDKRSPRQRTRKRKDSSYSSTSTSESDSSIERHRRKKSKKEHKTKKRKHKEKKRKKDKKRKKKKEKKSKKDKQPQKTAVNQGNYGKYGILTDPDIYMKQAEFYLWLFEVKKMNAETVPRGELKRYFDDFKEDYNTATLPHKKFYNLEAYEQRRRLKKMQKGYVDDPAPLSLINDEAAHRDLHRAQASSRYQMSREDLAKMQQAVREQNELQYKKALGIGADKRKF